MHKEVPFFAGVSSGGEFVGETVTLHDATEIDVQRGDIGKKNGAIVYMTVGFVKARANLRLKDSK